ncbi:hypothetical protein [Methylobacterium gnaphalii]|uniref:Uncharacterized protein n=2 Tax=Methylobacterium gnaphalii TaxID=1010610 RepID=A0A512JQF8_9HYPH|nr:hypothetical protein [Methylobacterium gnaphalii]GEP12200.1 hypothetical protein MGN01_40450 [Methylobacterium gnaphalii]GJD67462.1 hypothetical protein MMMDOFMJ_0377 [Methylobacterium gnaphalii]GLS51322.1 hypothetical protein GCM10007885_41770 [Methylobacterium gnaphalii]
MFEGLWRSATGAEIRLLQAGEAVSGTYAAIPEDAGLPLRCRMLVGTAEGDIIGFVTTSAAPLTIKSWTGRYFRPGPEGAPEIHAVCHGVNKSAPPLAMQLSVTLETTIFTKVADPFTAAVSDLAALSA